MEPAADNTRLSIARLPSACPMHRVGVYKSQEALDS